MSWELQADNADDVPTNPLPDVKVAGGEPPADS